MANLLNSPEQKEKNQRERYLQKGVILIFFLFFCAISSTASQNHIYGGNISNCPSTNLRYDTFAIQYYNEPLDIPDETHIQLAYTYAPVLWFYKDALQEEPFTLIEAEYFIEVSTKDSLGNYKLQEDGYNGAKYLQRQYGGLKNPVYIRVTTDDYGGSTYIVIQYWFHYLYNYSGALSLLDFNHEGEWEMIEIILEYDESLLNGTYPPPYIVAYSRHSGGEAHRWENEWIEKEEGNGYHPVAYIAYGTHAAYFRDLGWNEDLTKGIAVTHADMNFIVINKKEWLYFDGRWGGQENSPLGPQFQEIKWTTPVAWALKYMDNYLFHLERPGHLLIQNEKGERIGFVDEEFVNEIRDAYAVVTDEHEYYHVPEDDYSIEISADDGLGFDVIINEDGEVTHMLYKNELITHIREMYYDIHADIKEHALKLDKDGDGKIDLTITPEIIDYKDKGYPYLLYTFIAVIFLVFFIGYTIQRRIENRGFKSESESKRTRVDMAAFALRVVAVVFVFLWLITVITDLLGGYYEIQFLQLAVGIFLLSQVLPAFKREYSTGRKIQELLIKVGWPLLGLWIVFTALRYSRFVGTMEIGIDIGYFLAAGAVCLLLGYTVKFMRFIKERWTL